MAKADLTAARLRELLSYDPETGIFTRLVDVAKFKAGEQAGHRSVHHDGKIYVTMGVDGRKYFAHRLAWLYVHGSFPAGVMDHINGDSADNRIANLRDVTAQMNNQNQRRAHKDNPSGFQGVSWVKEKSRWRASLTVNWKAKFLGYFNTQEEAHACYLEAKRKAHEGCTL